MQINRERMREARIPRRQHGSVARGALPVEGVTVDVLLVVQPDPEVDAEAADRLVRRLRSELSNIDVDDIRPVAGEDVPDTAKAADPVTIGAIVVAMSASGGLFTSLVETVRDVLARHADRHKVLMTIGGDSVELTNATDEQREQLVRAFVRRHTSD
jgi:hypothetical protein